jgi:methylated-DNA-[protein]-cysteine S-methyltransferase
MRVYHAQVKTRLGEVTLLSDGAALTGLYFPHHWYMPDADTFGKAIDAQQDAILTQAASELQEYLSGERRALDVPLVARGDDFSERVWKLLRGIPYGQTPPTGRWQNGCVTRASLSVSAMRWGTIRCACSSPVTGSSEQTVP